MGEFLRDLRFGVRILVRNPGFAAAVVVCMALGIGATSAIFSVVNSVLLRPLPYVQPQRLVRVYTEFSRFPGGGLRRFWVSPPEYLDLKRETKSWETLDGWVNGGANLAGSAQPVRVTASFITGGMLRTLGINPLMGRLITPADDDPKASLTADISYGVWQRVFGGDPNIVGRETLLNGRKCTIIGVMPKDFAFPPGEVDPPEVWSPLQIDPAKPGGRGSHFLYLLGRLKPGLSAQQAQAELNSLVDYWGKNATPKTHVFHPDSHTLVSFPLQGEVISGVRPALLMLLGAVGFVLLIACVNVANLLLARAEARQREIAIRSALGAAFPRLLRQFVTEGVILSSLGGLLGLALAYAGLRLIKLTNAGALPRASEIGMDGRVLLFAVGVALFTGVLFGLAPAFHILAANTFEVLKNAAGWSTGSGAAQSFRRVLVSSEIAIALVLLIGCGLMIRAFWKLQQVDIGIDAQNLVTMRVTLPAAAYNDNDKVDSLWTRLEERLQRLPGVQSVALVTGLPPARRVDANDTKIEGFVQRDGGPLQNVDYYQAVSKNYFETMKIRLVEGRFFDDRDGKGGTDSVIINQTMARMFYGNESAVGRRIQPGFSDPWCTIVGVVGDVKNAGVDKPTGTELYLPLHQKQAAGSTNMYVVARGNADSGRIAASLRRELVDIDPTVPVSSVRTMDDVLSASRARPRFLTLLLSLFSSSALLLALVGIYGVLSYAVARRSKEFGLRMALGATPGHVLNLVLSQGGLLAATGVAAGLAAALALTRLMSGLLYGVRATDPLTFIVVPLALAIVALAASYIPARRATRVDPMVALRYE